MAGSLSPDGKWAATIITSPPQLVLLPTRAGTPKSLKRGTISKYERVEWFPDGKRVLLTGSEQGHGWRCYVQETEGGDPRPITPEGTAATLPTPDGKWILIRGPDQKYSLLAVEGGDTRPVLGLEAMDTPIRWSSECRSLFAREAAGPSLKVFRVEPYSGRRELWKEIMPSDPAGLLTFAGIMLSADGKSYVYSYPRTLSDLYLADGLK